MRAGCTGITRAMRTAATAGALSKAGRREQNPNQNGKKRNLSREHDQIICSVQLLENQGHDQMEFMKRYLGNCSIDLLFIPQSALPAPA